MEKLDCEHRLVALREVDCKGKQLQIKFLQVSK